MDETLEQRLRNPKEIIQFLTQNPEPKRTNLETTTVHAITGILSKEAREGRLTKETAIIARRYTLNAINRTQEETIQQSRLYAHAANFALYLTQKFEGEAKIKNARTAYTEYSKSIDLALRTNDEETAAYTYSFKGDAARIVAENTSAGERIKWYIRAGESILESAKRTEHTNKTHSKYQYSFAARYKTKAADNMNHTPKHREQLLKEAIQHIKKSIELHDREDLFWAGLHYDIGKAGSLLFKTTNNPEDAQKAITHYEKAIEVYEKNPSRKETLKNEAKRRVQELKGLIV